MDLKTIALCAYAGLFVSIIAFLVWQYYELRKAKYEKDRQERELEIQKAMRRSMKEQTKPVTSPASGGTKRPSRHSVTRPTRVSSHDSGLTTGMALGSLSSGGSCGGFSSSSSSFGGGCD